MLGRRRTWATPHSIGVISGPGFPTKHGYAYIIKASTIVGVFVAYLRDDQFFAPKPEISPEQARKIEAFHLRTNSEDSVASTLATRAIGSQSARISPQFDQTTFNTYADVPHFKEVFADTMAFYAMVDVMQTGSMKGVGEAMGKVLTTLNDEDLVKRSLDQFVRQLKSDTVKLPAYIVQQVSPNERRLSIEEKIAFTNGLQAAGLSRENGLLLVAAGALDDWVHKFAGKPTSNASPTVPSVARLGEKLSGKSLGEDAPAPSTKPAVRGRR